MRVRDWQDILSDVVESDAEPDSWRAVAGDRRGGVGEDLFLGHPSAGVFHLKTYAKNPFEVRGVGAKVARRVDEDIEPLFPREAPARFGVHQGPADEEEAEEKSRALEEVVQTHADAPTTPDALFEDVMDVLDSPAFGPMEYDQYDRPDALDELSTTFADAQEAVEAEFEDIVQEDDVGKSFR